MDEFKVRVAPTTTGKKFNIFKLHRDDQIAWAETKIRRDNDFQPWQIKVGNGRIARRFKAIKEGGVGDNASYFIFYKSNEATDTYEVCPVEDWFNVSATQRYKTLTAEEAEQKFEQRHKTLNYFSVMHMRKNGETGEDGPPVRDSKAFKVSEMDDWEQSGDDFGSDADNDDDESKKKQNRKKSVKKEKDDPEDAPEEGKEDSDEGDFEQREVDYMSESSSDSDPEEDGKDDRDKSDVKGIAEEEALRDLLSTDDEEDAEHPHQKGTNSSTNKNMLGTVDIKHESDGDDSDDSSDSNDYDVDEDKIDSMFMKKSLPAQLMKQEAKLEPEANNSSSSGPSTSSSTSTVAAGKRKPQQEAPIAQRPPKRPCPVESSSAAPANGQERILEELIRKYLGRRPMTLKLLLSDIKRRVKRMGGPVSEMTHEELVETIALIIRRIDPEKQRINGTIYYQINRRE